MSCEKWCEKRNGGSWVYQTLGTSSEYWVAPQGVERVPQGCWPMLTPVLPTVVSCWLDALWVVNQSWYTRGNVKRKRKTAVLQFLKQNRCALVPTTMPKALKYFVLPIHPLHGTRTQSMSRVVSRLKHPSFNLSPPLHIHWLKWI
jgi:hypothetical protein